MARKKAAAAEPRPLMTWSDGRGSLTLYASPSDDAAAMQQKAVTQLTKLLARGPVETCCLCGKTHKVGSPGFDKARTRCVDQAKCFRFYPEAIALAETNRRRREAAEGAIQMPLPFTSPWRERLAA